MRYEQLKTLGDVEFKRLCGVKRHTLETMCEALKAAEETKTKPGRPSKLALEDQLLMTLLYWREYRTLFHLGTERGISEGTASRQVRWVEDVLIRSGRFTLPKRAERFAETPGKMKVVAGDATETPVERKFSIKRGNDEETAATKRQRHVVG